MGAPLSTWPWEYLGSYKYLLYGPFFGKVLHTRIYEGGFKDEWCLHIIILCTIRVLLHIFWGCFSSMLFVVRNLRIKRNGYDFKQIDSEWNWDNMIILQALVAGIACYNFPEFIENVPLWNLKGFVITLILHVAISEPLYYWVHRYFHTKNYLFTHYHSLQHSSPVLHPFTGANATFLEQLIFTSILGIPLIGCSMMGFASKSILYGYIITFDFLRCFGHCNVEFIPYRMFELIPFLKYLIYTPTYRMLHHTDKDTNFCLFMPVFDAIWNTLNVKSWDMHKKNCERAGKDEGVADFVFLAHVVDITCSMHAPFVNRAFSSLPYSTRFFLIPFWPVPLIIMILEWIFAKCFTVASYNLKGKLHETWAVPRYGFQYFLPFAKDGINKQIEHAILKADKLGVKVISLAALNKNEALNGGGTLFVDKHPELRVRVVHGNTLTAAVILNEIPKDVKEVFLTGATSKLGRAIALYLCRKKIRVLMLTLSTERFQKIQEEAPLDCHSYLVHVTKYQAAQTCKTWIVGKWITPREQSWAPPGTRFHQFVVPPILSFRRDCIYGDLAAMRLPEDVQGLGCCEYTMERGVVHACHAGGVVHNLEGWTHHEVGAIDVDRIDLVWNAAMKYGFKPVA